MIKQVEGFDEYVAIAGFRDARIDDVDCFLSLVREELGNVTVQFFDAGLVSGWHHLYFATLNALNAFKNRMNISKNLAVECLLFASAQRQIKAALGLIGIKPRLSRIAVLIISNTEGAVEKSLEKVSKLIHGRRDDSVLDLTEEKVGHIREVFGISDVELAAKSEKGGEEAALSELVIEHVALLVTQR